MIDTPEIIPVPEQPQPQKNLTPVAIKPTKRPIFDPEREGKEEAPERKRGRANRGDPEQADNTAPTSVDPELGTRLDIRA